MAKGNNRTGKGCFKKGESGNYNGRPKLSLEAKTLKKLTLDDFVKLVCSFFNMTKEELLIKSKEEKASLLELYLSSVFFNGIKRGDYATLDKILDRAIGKIPVKIEGEIKTALVEFVNGDENKDKVSE